MIQPKGIKCDFSISSAVLHNNMRRIDNSEAYEIEFSWRHYM